jgi:hypothetical protein
MVDIEKIKWLGSEFQSLPRFRKKNTYLSNRASLRFLKKEVERLKDMLTKQKTSDERYEISKILNRTIRRAQDICQNIYSIHYYEKFEQDQRRVNEHVIPQNLLTDAYLEGHITFGLMLGMPLVNLSEASDQLIAGKGLSKLNSNWLYPFRRYRIAGIDENIYTPSGQKIDFENWSLTDHFKLYKEIDL